VWLLSQKKAKRGKKGAYFCLPNCGGQRCRIIPGGFGEWFIGEGRDCSGRLLGVASVEVAGLFRVAIGDAVILNAVKDL